MLDTQNGLPGLPPAEVGVENSWRAISQFVINLGQGRNPGPVHVGNHVPDIHNFTDARNLMRLGLGDIAKVDRDWRHDEV